jgi:hypothetical protein
MPSQFKEGFYPHFTGSWVIIVEHLNKGRNYACAKYYASQILWLDVKQKKKPENVGQTILCKLQNGSGSMGLSI